MSYILIIPGEAPVKKNARKEAYSRKDERGNFQPLAFPISYYSKEYNEWAWKAVQYLRHWKENWIKEYQKEYPETYPLLKGQWVCTMWFFRSHIFNTTGQSGKGSGQTIDLQNLYDSILDCLAGNSGINIPKKLQMEHEDYKILQDDSFAFIKSHGASHIFFDPTNPRTEVYLSPYSKEMLGQAFRLFHPDTQPLSYGDAISAMHNFPLIEKEKRIKSSDIKLDFDLNNFLFGDKNV